MRPWQLSVLMLLVCAAAIGYLEWRRQTRDTSDRALLSRLPSTNAVRLYINVQALRQAGLLEMLAGSKAAEETDYRDFVRTSGFDYREDLDAIFASFRRQRSFFLLRGRFNWDMLRSYATAHGGDCLNGFCNVPLEGSSRNVSFFTVLPNVLALAIGEDRFGAYAMIEERPLAERDMPRQPLWFTAPASLLEEPAALPAGARAFVSALKGSESLTLALDGAGNRFEAVIRVSCRTPADAEAVRIRLEQVTDLLRRFIEREKLQPNPRDLSGVLTAGVFRSEGHVVHGRWPVERVFLEALAEGKL